MLPKVLFACAIYHMPKHFCACVDTGACDSTFLLKRPVCSCISVFLVMVSEIDDINI